MKRTLALVVIRLLVLAGLSGSVPTLAAQGVQTGSIRGTVVDQQGLPIGNITVTVTSKTLQGQRTATTAADGTYAFRQLPAGEYQITFETPQLAPIRQTTSVWLGLSVDQQLVTQADGGTAPAPVLTETQAVTATPIVVARFTHDEIGAVPTLRTLSGIAQLAPGVTTRTPGDGQVSINGAFAFDSAFLLNGVDVSDDLSGAPQDLFIEDAIEETVVMTSGITAEYGRFTGGIVNAITKSGGNSFSGSYRMNLSNPSWTRQTPFELCDPVVTLPTCRVAAPRLDAHQMSHEGTFGGPLAKDRLWFFAAGRYSDRSNASTLPLSDVATTQTDTNERGEIKLTATLAPSHTLAGGYTTNNTTSTRRPAFDFTVDPNAIGDRKVPNNYSFATYRGALQRNVLVEAQFSQRRLEFRDSGGTGKALADSPFFALTILTGGSPAHYNAQYLDASDPESRNNLQLTGNLTYLKNTRNAGRHELKVGYEFFRRQRIGGNAQSSTDYVYDTDYLTDETGSAPVLDSQGRFIPLWLPGQTLIEHWLPVRGDSLSVDYDSTYAQDHWTIKRLSVDLGMRFERVKSESTGGIVGVDTKTILPRLGVGYDVKGNGRHVVHATYGEYAGRYHDAQIAKDWSVDTPDLLVGIYTGLPGEGRDFEAGFDPKNYITLLGRAPAAHTGLEEGLSSPIVTEFSTSYGLGMMNGRGFAQIAYVAREWSNAVENDISISNGTTHLVEDGFDAGTFTNVVYRNTEVATRAYRALEFQGRFQLAPRWVVNGNYTVQLRNEGNQTDEGTNTAGAMGPIGDYPEILSEARHYPIGRLPEYQRHKLRLWSIFNADFGRMGTASISGVIRTDSATTYSLAAAEQALTAIQRARLLAAGYPDAPSSQTVYFGARGSETFRGYGAVDIGLGYNIPLFATLTPWVRFDIYNAFNNQQLLRWDTAVSQDPSSPADDLGLSTGYRKGARFGKATSNDQFLAPFPGETGGRTFLLAGGFRF